MPNLKTSIKDLRKNRRKEVINDRIRDRVKRARKKERDLIASGNIEEAKKRRT